jgi:hypothetical protein
VAEYLSQYDVDIRLIDCMEEFKPRGYNTGKYSNFFLSLSFSSSLFFYGFGYIGWFVFYAR